MNANELAEALEGRARVRRKITNRENTGDRLSDQLDQAATMLRQQQATIEEMLEALITVEAWLSSGCATGFESKVAIAILKAQEK